MRYFIALLVVTGMVLAGGLGTTGLIAAANAGSYASALQQQPPTGELDVDIDVGGGGAWWTNPVWIAIGVVALVVLVLIIAMAARGGGTTIIRD
jgi:hypothetical protein